MDSTRLIALTTAGLKAVLQGLRDPKGLLITLLPLSKDHDMIIYEVNIYFLVSLESNAKFNTSNIATYAAQWSLNQGHVRHESQTALSTFSRQPSGWVSIRRLNLFRCRPMEVWFTELRHHSLLFTHSIFVRLAPNSIRVL